MGMHGDAFHRRRIEMDIPPQAGSFLSGNKIWPQKETWIHNNAVTETIEKSTLDSS